ncbi:hypothetical protein AVEN_157130-1 [Araneus ventricosus]|uniref:Uncharacterized protein n=1 Tax=Araneus ventricosus TaxID=182803 RepID=A0A4Y2N4B8_ARAVE|nr:hypothetical protein AVEN_274200-1 [Araneus ventricosus]GBN34341.1 hypothetical protein AVEN_157130-1 [Araneus ventricosus]
MSVSFLSSTRLFEATLLRVSFLAVGQYEAPPFSGSFGLLVSSSIQGRDGNQSLLSLGICRDQTRPIETAPEAAGNSEQDLLLRQTCPSSS